MEVASAATNVTDQTAATNAWLEAIRNRMLDENEMARLEKEFQTHEAVDLTDDFGFDFSWTILKDMRRCLTALRRQGARGSDPIADHWTACPAEEHAPHIWALFWSRAWLDVIHKITNLNVPAVDKDSSAWNSAHEDGVTLLWHLPQRCFFEDDPDGIEVRLIKGTVQPESPVVMHPEGTALALQWRL